LKHILVFLLGVLLFSAGVHAQPGEAACSRFRVHLGAALPNVPHSSAKRELPEELAAAIKTWERHLDFLKDEERRREWLACIQEFIYLDTDGDSVPDWTAVADGRPSQVLFPLDPDIDGDGLPNILDPDPYRPNPNFISDSGKVPKHLRIKGESAKWQAKLWRNFRVLAVDHSDRHRSEVLRTLHSTLGLPAIQSWRRRSQSLRVVYAFESHDPHFQIAAYHPSAAAMSVPGVQGYPAPEKFSEAQRCQLTGALVHELGHALLFSSIPARELQEKAARFGDWELPESIPTIWSPLWLVRGLLGPRSVSAYSTKNVHEWFAESFAAFVFQRDGLNTSTCRPFANSKMSKEFTGWLTDVLHRE
jgi:hypothetical protein